MDEGNGGGPERRDSPAPQSECIGPQVTEVLAKMHGIATALRTAVASSSPTSKLDLEIGTFSIGTKDSQAAVRSVGEALQHAVKCLTQAVEDQIVEFYRHMKQQVMAEHELLRSTRSLVPTDPSLFKHLQFAPEPPVRRSSPIRSSNTANNPRARSPASTAAPQGRTKDIAVVKDTLRAALYLMLEGVMNLTDATRGAIYLRASEGSEYLRRVCDINAADNMPLDVSPAAGSTIGTVVRHHIGVSIAKSRADNPEALEYFSQASQAVRSSVALKVHNAVIIPMPGDVGCVIVADKATYDSSFSMVDEHHVLSLSSMVLGIVKRYPQSFFMEKAQPAVLNLLLAHSELPPITALDDPTTAKTVRPDDGLEQCLGRMMPGLDALLPKPTRLVMVKASPNFASLLSAKNVEGCERAELSDEDLLEAAVPYIKNLEALWRKSIDHMTSLRSDCETWSREMERKNARISELEAEGRSLWRQYVSLKADVSRLKLSTVPQQLHETLKQPGPDGETDPLAREENFSSAKEKQKEASGAKFGHERKRFSSVKPLNSLASSGHRGSVSTTTLAPKAPLTAR